MSRRRIRNRSFAPASLIGRLLVALLALALAWYGLMTLLLALKVSPSTVNSLSGYRSAFDWLADLRRADVSGRGTRAILAGAGLLVFLIFGFLAWKALPRPSVARQDLQLVSDPHGQVHVSPRAVERLAETAAKSHPNIADASGRFERDLLSVGVTVSRPGGLADTLNDAQARVAAALEQHELPLTPINVILTGFHGQTGRNLR